MTDKILIDRSMVEQALDMFERGRFANKDVDGLEALCDVLRAALEQPAEQEPVAEITGMDEYGPMFGWHKHWVEFPVGTKLYIHQQPPRQPLTDEQIDALYIEGRQHWLGKRQIARAIEAVHGIGE